MEEYEQQHFFDKIQEINEDCKEKELFNAFLTIGVTSQEVMHSKFIGMLLDTNAEHKQKDKFLKLFLKQICIDDFQLSNVKVKCEKCADNRRRMDITLENNCNQIIIIENKVRAGDQDRQLIDYYGYALKEKKKEDVFMIYLTPYGQAPSAKSLGGEVFDIKCISYEKDIIAWIEKCIVEISNERLRLSLKMYEELIRNIINRNKYMTEILETLIKSPKKMELAFDVINSLKGRNFLEFPELRNSFIAQIDNAAWGFLETFNIYPDEEGLVFAQYEETVFTVCFDGAHIYAKRKDINEQLFEIACNDINNTDLIFLLTQNEEGVQQWVEQILKHIGIIK